MDVQDKVGCKTEPLTYEASGILDKELEDELMKFTKKDVDYKVDVHMVKQTGSNNDMDVNITECTKSLGKELLASEYQDTTECSSSFEDSSLGIENVNPLDDSEVLSDFCDDAASALDFSGFNDKFRMRKKKLSPHWRSFVQPLVWRCKWVELQIKKLQTQAQEYDRELEAYNKQKQIQLENSTLEHGVKSLPFSQDNARSDILKRKKRRRTEATTDLAAYMSHHNLFSYYVNKKGSSESAFISNEIRIPVGAAYQKVNIDDEFLANNELFSPEPGDSDHSMEHLLCKIYNLQSRVSKLKDRDDKLLNEIAEMFPDIWTFTTPCSASSSNNGERMGLRTYIASQLLSEYNMGDALATESGVTSHGDAPDANEHVEDGDLIDNHRVKDEMNSFEEVKISPVGMIKSIDEETSHFKHSPPLGVKDEPVDASPSVLSTDDQPVPKVHSIAKITAPKGKRKRGKRNGGARWS